MTEEVPSVNPKLDAIGEMLKTIHNLKKENKLLGKRCLQLQKDKGKLIDECKKLKTELDFMERACDGAAEMYDDLKAARKIIQSFVWWHTGEDRGSIDSNDLVERAKQFLKEHE